MWVVLLFSFVSSIAVSEDACCSIFGDYGTSSSVEKTESGVGVLGMHVCENGKDTSDTHGDHFHFCVGCSHSPFVKNESLSLREVNQPSRIKRSELFVYIENPYLDGPFQPPRA